MGMILSPKAAIESVGAAGSVNQVAARGIDADRLARDEAAGFDQRCRVVDDGFAGGAVVVVSPDG